MSTTTALAIYHHRPRLVSCPQITIIKAKQENNDKIRKSSLINESVSETDEIFLDQSLVSDNTSSAPVNKSGGSLTAVRNPPHHHRGISPSRRSGAGFSTPLVEEGSAHNSPFMSVSAGTKTATAGVGGGTSPLKMEAPATGSGGGRVRRSSDSDVSTPPKGQTISCLATYFSQFFTFCFLMLSKMFVPVFLYHCCSSFFLLPLSYHNFKSQLTLHKDITKIKLHKIVKLN